MEISIKTPVLLFLIICINSLSGLNVPQPVNLAVNISDEEVIVYWTHPVDAPLNSKYNVQMGKYIGKWTKVESCTGITNSFCDLSSLIHDYNSVYKVKVQLVTGDNESSWTDKKFSPNESKLQHPSFTLVATSGTLSVYVHHKPILRKLFPYGLTYTIYLEEKGRDNKTTTAYLKDDGMGEEKRTKTFSSLHWGKQYCVSMKVGGNGAPSTSKVSPKQCLLLPEQEWFIIAVSSLSFLSIIVVTAIILLCYLRRPEKTPAVLKSPVTYWLPLSADDGTMEVVTDKGWFLSSYRTEVKNCVKDPVTHVKVTEDNGEQERRKNMGSGVSMKSNSATDNGGGHPIGQEDSGCGSLGGPESSTSSQTNYSLQDERNDTDKDEKREDSGVGLGCQLNSFSINLEGQDSRPPAEPVLGGNYRTQNPTTVQIHLCDDNKAFKQLSPETVLAEVVTGYRAGPQWCICSGAGQCIWCHKQSHNGSEDVKQYRAMCIGHGPLSSKCDFVDSLKVGLTFSSFSQRSEMDTVMVDDFLQLGETFPMLPTLPPLPLEDEGHDFNMNNVSLSLCDVQLKTD